MSATLRERIASACVEGFSQSPSMSSTQELAQQVKEASQWIAPLQAEISRVVVGQKYLVDGLLTGLLTNGHILLEGVPGLAKTLTVKTLAQAIRTGFQRIQFTPDLLPADLVGTLIYNPRTGEFTTKHGPLFSNLILADEINRAPAKVQSALLEAMQERQVTIGEETYRLPDPFLVLATQNPLEQEGTYQLPEAQLDRFMLKLRVGYPTRTEERQILDLMATSAPALEVAPITEPADILRARALVNDIYVDDRVKDYIVDVVFATRDPVSYRITGLDGMIRYGASPRATIALTLAARARAFLAGRGYVTPQDVKSIGADVLRHRIIVSYEAEAEEITSEQIIERIFGGLAVP
jgi:MoxR-like ATPase